MREIAPREMLSGVALAAAAMAFQVIWLGTPAVFLSLAMVLALALWLFSPWQYNPGVRIWFGLGIGIFVVHAAEEYLTGFQRTLPALFEQSWSDTQFLVFNGVFLALFLVMAGAFQRDRPLPMLVIIFFMVAGGLGNGVFHLALWVQRGQYFPGGWSAPLCLLVGGALVRALYRHPVDV